MRSKSATTADVGGLVDIGHGVHGPAGSTADVASTGVAHVAAVTTDPDGRIWFGTADYDDRGHDGVYVQSGTSKPFEVLPNQHTVLGLAWFDGDLYVASKERVDAYSGFDGAVFAKSRNIVTFAPGVGELNQIVMGPDGRFRLGISAPCDSCVPTVPYGGTVVSFRPDGSDLRPEAVRIRAPIAFSIVPGTADILMTMNQRDDLGDRTPGDWLAQLRTGQDWRQPDCYGQGDPACIGVPEPIATLDRHAAVSGVAVLGNTSGSAGGATAIVAEWSKGRVLRVPLRATRNGWIGSPEPFLTGISKPMAVFAALGGSLLVGDWQSGMIYRIT